MRVRRAVVLGSSISLISRPANGGIPYPRVLEEKLNAPETNSSEIWLVINKSRVAGIIADIGEELEEIVGLQPDVVILHFGYVESLHRPHSRTLWKIAHLRRPGRSRLQKRAATAARKIGGLRRRLRLSQQWLPFDQFAIFAEDTIAYILRECGCELIVIGLNPGSSEIESYMRGAGASIAAYDYKLALLSEQYGATFIPVSSIVSCSQQRFMPDGTHFSAEGHKAVANAIYERICTSADRF